MKRWLAAKTALKRPGASHVAFARRRTRAGFTLTELAISGVVLVAVMGISASIGIRTTAVWKDVRRHRVATHELANQIDQLTRLSRQEAEGELAELELSDVARSSLPECRLSGRLAEDKLGVRVRLELAWKTASGPTKTIQLSGWLVEAESQPETTENFDDLDDSQDNTDDEQTEADR